MRRATLGGAALALLAANAAQVPFQADPDPWDLDVAPNINATGHLIFDTVSSFLQHWPNTRYRNGHSLVPGIVPVGTLLYHGRGDSNLPTVPEWIATDPEHSTIFCRGSTDAGCWHLTLVATRPLKVLYFDGSSAAKMNNGPMDTQDIVAWGEVLPDRYFLERQRSVDLCAWGKPFGIEGYLRMEMDFEIILCDFTAGVEVVSMANLASNGRGGPGRGPGGPGGPGGSPLEETFDATAPATVAAVSEVILSGSWHNRYPGDRRIKLDLTQLISFYDTALVPSLVATRFNVERWEHRLLGISSEDIAAVKDRLATAYTVTPVIGSGVDWDTLFKVVVDRYDGRLEVVRYLLNDTAEDLLETAKKAMKQFRIMLTPYILHSAVPPTEGGNAWAAPVFEFCSTSHTSYIRGSESINSKLTPAEQLLLRAVEETNREICRVVVSMWAEGVLAGLDDALPFAADTETPAEAMLVRKWSSAIERLVSWLDWSVWIKCRPECSFEEICYLPTWPFFGGGGGGGGPGDGRRERPRGPGGRLPMPEDPDILHPQPRCVGRFD